VDFKKNGRVEFGEGPMGAFQDFQFRAFYIDFYDVRWAEALCSVDATVQSCGGNPYLAVR
jgi:hypothetical protein